MASVADATDAPPHMAALLMLANRCANAEARKELIVAAAMAEAISVEEGSLMLTAYQLETA